MGKLRFTILLAACLLIACKKDKNPFDGAGQTPNKVDNPISGQDPNTFVAIHNNILKPTCANSGCHDGTNVNDPAFPPIDFTTLEASYTSLIKGPVRKNNNDQTYTYLVDPGNPAGSAMLGRMLDDANNPGALMPLEVDEGSDWYQKRDQYINNVRTWIANGAPNVFGVPYSEGNARPNFLGFMGATPTVTKLGRAGAQTEIQIPFSADEVTFSFSFSDVETQPTAFTHNKVKISASQNDFSNATEYDLTILNQPFTEGGRAPGSEVSYTHQFTITGIKSLFPVNKVFYVRVYVQDEYDDPTEIPNNGNSSQVIQYFSFTRFNG